MVSRTLLSLLGLGLAVRGQPALRTEDGSILASVDKSTGADFGVKNTATGTTDTWGAVRGDLGDVQGDLGTVQQMLGLTRRQAPADPADASNQSLPALMTDMIATLDQVLSATQSNGAAALAANSAYFTVAYPAEISSQGGMVKIGGYNFIPGIAIYTATWTYTTDSGGTNSVSSEPTAATSMGLLEVEAPSWPHQPAQNEYIGALTIMQDGTPVPTLGGGVVTTTFQAQAPTMTDLSGNLQARDFTGTSFRFNMTVADVDSDSSDVRLTFTFTNTSFVTSIRDISDDVGIPAESPVRTIEVIFPGGDGCGQTNVTVTATDNIQPIGLSSNQTFELFIDCSSWVTVVRTANSRSNYGNFGRGPQQMASRLVGDTGSNIGAFREINTVTGARYIRITKLSGARNAGEYATFRFVAPLARTLLGQILACGETNSYTRSSSVTRWTARYSGTKVDGDLPLYNRYNQRQSLRYVFICGINTSSDDDHSILAFTYRLGYSNDWGDSWRGSYQRGTVWSLFNDDYKGGRGWSSVQAGPGYKAGSNNAGGYEIAISTAASL